LRPEEAAGGHGPVLAEVERIVVEPVEVLEQRVAAQAAIGDQIVEARHHRRLVERREGAQLDRPGREALTVVRRVLARVVHERLELLALVGLQALARPALALGQLPRDPEGAPDVDDALEAVAHGATASRGCGALASGEGPWSFPASSSASRSRELTPSLR
jgi:hypothetical protein